MWIVAAFGISASLIMDFATKYVAKLFSINDPETVSIWSSTTLLSWAYLGTSLLQATNRPGLGLTAALIGQGLLFPAVSTFWFYYAHDPVSMFWSGLTNDTIAVTLTSLFCIPVFLELKRRYRERGMYEQIETAGQCGYVDPTFPVRN
jgi:hypothetical protein